jgi:DNA-binding transcriptional ArsR family regulator
MNDEVEVSVEPAVDGPEPLDERLISDVETLRALSDPLRLRILEVMTAGADETFTVKRLAKILGTSQTRLYHHVNQLAERELIAVASQRVVSGIIETSYRVGQRNVRLDRRLLAADGPAMHDTLATIFDTARDDIERGLRTGVITTAEDADPGSKLLLARGLARLTPERAAVVRQRLVELFDEFGADDPSTPPDADVPSYGLVLSFYAMTDEGETDR